ncbi:hypothetical protein W02_01700 [Nitrospira sp. KM1]|uniref:hypothetical protein n=1 Tax=Nitrospira sp. KM1 TaxID=1936990 RepID=UPI0013A78777|nr:hypothetical protein [Nitrospira sp. KM1]BCA53030.1 hypothetical protein W02_01700 [Nitrospira sp. KM1]
MRAVAETTELPFADRQNDEAIGHGLSRETQDWFLALRHARVPFYPQDRLLLLYGHPLVFRLGLHAATERVLAGEPVIYLDGASTFDPFVIGRLARVHRRQPRQILNMIHVARAFTCHQMERLVSQCLDGALDRYQARIVMLSGLLDTFYEQTVPEPEASRLFARIMETMTRLSQQGITLLCLCPPAPILTNAGRRCLEQLRAQADRVIRVQEEHGLVQLHDEGSADGQSWEVARAALIER